MDLFTHGIHPALMLGTPNLRKQGQIVSIIDPRNSCLAPVKEATIEVIDTLRNNRRLSNRACHWDPIHHYKPRRKQDRGYSTGLLTIFLGGVIAGSFILLLFLREGPETWQVSGKIVGLAALSGLLGISIITGISFSLQRA